MTHFSKIILLFSILLSFQFSFSQPPKKKQKERVLNISKKKKDIPVDSVKSIKKKSKYESFFDKSEVKKGLFTIIIKENKYYLDIPDSLLHHNMLLGSRIVKTSSGVGSNAAGMMVKSPLQVYFSRIEKKVFLHQKTNFDQAEGDKAISAVLKKNTLDPILLGFSAKEFNKDSSSCIVDVTNLFLSDIKPLNPFPASRGIIKKPSGIFKSNRSAILEVKNFEKNMTVKSLMSYDVAGKPYTTVLNRTLLLLPDSSNFKPRIMDNRVGYFGISNMKYKRLSDELEKINYISKWSVYPKEEDIEAYKKGELVEPIKPIVYHLDTNFPEFWKKHIREGVLTWNQAFEKIGFKNTVQVKDYPKNDSLFDPENLKYTCIRYVTSPVINAFGPSWKDPRTGEILQADIVFFHNLTKIIHAWKFAQTAAVDPKVRGKYLSEEDFGEVIKYVAAHEAGHTLGLPHNMAASSSFPVDSLRSASFTQKYGTTASIMDYARFNYVAQPEDVDVKLTPPDLGVYDEYAIAWGYKPLLNIEKPEDEYETLNKWITSHSGDPMYRFGQQQFRIVDPSSQTEDLGDDVLKASQYGIKNINYILDRFVEWRKEDSKGYEEIGTSYTELLKQYNQYIYHLTNTIGGTYLNNIIQSDTKKAFSFVDKGYQRKIVYFLFEEMKRQKAMWERDDIIEKLSPNLRFTNDYHAQILDKLVSKTTLNKLIVAEANDPKTYSLDNLFYDINYHIWMKTKQGRSLTEDERNLQFHYVKSLLRNGGYVSSSIFSLFSFDAEENHWGCSHQCNHEYIDEVNADTKLIKTGLRESSNTSKIKIKIFSELKKTQSILKKAQHSGNEKTRYHYQYLLNEIKNKLDKQ